MTIPIQLARDHPVYQLLFITDNHTFIFRL